LEVSKKEVTSVSDSTVSGCSKKRKKSLKCGASSGHTTKLEQSISLDIFVITN
jgi:hypothetical protein